ncbi:MAG: hypothetical protein KGI50_05860 [Patescibacteria group bacterium]|nr:hypothetical protein [Patescibacteria group bacterium]MDE2438801.1 hypothetical protein [Patescibacteria group bacterium]
MFEVGDQVENGRIVRINKTYDVEFSDGIEETLQESEIQPIGLRLRLGNIATDNVGGEWKITVEMRNWRNPAIPSYMLTEICSDRVPRTAHASRDGMTCICTESAVIKKIISVREE